MTLSFARMVGDVSLLGQHFLQPFWRPTICSNRPWGVYIAHTPPKEPLGKADRIPESRLIRRSSFVITGSTSECFFPATSRYCSNGYLINCTNAIEFIVGLTGVCKLRNPQKRSLWTTAPTLVFRHRRFNRRQTLASASGSIAPMPSFFPSSVHLVHSAD